MRAVPLLAVLLLLAGCLGGPRAPTDPSAGGQVPAPEPEGRQAPGADAEALRNGALLSTDPPAIEVLLLPFTITLDGGKSLVAGVADEDPRLDFGATGATAMVVELAWTGGPFDLDLHLLFDDDCPEGGELGEFAACMAPEAEDHWLEEGDDGNYWVKAGGPAAPDSPIYLVIGAEALAAYGCAEDCGGFARAISKDVAAGVDGELVVSIFRGEPVPDGYTARTV